MCLSVSSHKSPTYITMPLLCFSPSSHSSVSSPPPANQGTEELLFFSHLVKHSKYYLTQLIWNQEADTQPNQLLFIQVTCLGPNCLGFFASVFIPLGLALECYGPYHSLFRVSLDFSLVFFLHIPFLFPQLFLPPFPPCICISSLIYFPENIHSAALLIMAGW